MASTKALNTLKTITAFIKKTKGFDECMNKVTIVSAGDGKCRAEFTVAKEHLNGGGGLHGGFTATLVDAISTYALIATEKAPPGVSVDIHVSYLKGAREGEEVIVEANTVKAGKSLAFLDVLLSKKDGGDIIAKGSHTKFIGS